MIDAATYLAKSFATLDKHAASGKFDITAALRLLRNNARDILPPGTSFDIQQQCAIELLQQWQNRIN